MCSGIHTTNIAGQFSQGKIILYKTGVHHAGEILAQILSYRTFHKENSRHLMQQMKERVAKSILSYKFEPNTKSLTPYCVFFLNGMLKKN